MNTPWGIADHIETVAPGIQFVSTPSHGGYVLADDLQVVMKALRLPAKRFYEEDCEAAFVALAFSQHMLPGAVDRSLETIGYFYPEYAQAAVDCAKEQITKGLAPEQASFYDCPF